MLFGCLLETRVNEGKSVGIIISVFRDWSSVANYLLSMFKE